MAAALPPYDIETLPAVGPTYKSYGYLSVQSVDRCRWPTHAVRSAGSLWQEESYDRIVRDEEHLWRVIQYIGRNPSKANLPREQWHRWIHTDWQSAGWHFQDDA